VPSLKKDNLALCYYLSASEIWNDMRVDLIIRGLLYKQSFKSLNRSIALFFGNEPNKGFLASCTKLRMKMIIVQVQWVIDWSLT
jgi:hypothetical protein